MKTKQDKAYLNPSIAHHIWDTKYRFASEASIQDSWQRVARAVAGIEPQDQEYWQEQFYSILDDYRFLPGGRILAGAGTGQRVTLFNCFVMGVIEDSMEGIFEHIKEGALTMQAGGGVGYDFSTLRPEGSPALASGRIASGPVSFMHIWDAACATIMSTGARRGAMIASLRCDHPDIEQFIDAKHEAGSLTHFNLSVQVSDDFMQAVKDDAEWPLVYPHSLLDESTDNSDNTLMREWPGMEGPVKCKVFRIISARSLWRKIMQANYDTAEPGVLFTDRINQLNNLGYRETISATNPCGEIPLPPYGACNLGSVNLTRFIEHPFTSEARIDYKGINDTVSIAVRMMDNVIDLSWFPLPQQEEQARSSRRMGLGITGLADALIMLGQHYGEKRGRATAAQIMQTICHSAYRSSVDLSKTRGSFPKFAQKDYLARPFIQRLPTDIHEAIAKHGIRNSHLTAIAPAGTISLLAGNVSSGIEPVFAFRQTRRVLNIDGDYETFALNDFAFDQWQNTGHDVESLPPCFSAAHDLSPEQHLLMQSELQQFIDNAISKTINIPEDYPFDDFCSLYERAYELGLKGCTTFRPNTVRGEILKSSSTEMEDFVSGVPCCSLDREES